MSDDRSRTCDTCLTQWRGDVPCWACGQPGVVGVRSMFSGATWRVEDYDRDMAEAAGEAS